MNTTTTRKASKVAAPKRKAAAPTPDQVEHDFMMGKALAADLIKLCNDAAKPRSPEVGNLHAEFRGRGVPQWNIASEYLDEVFANRGLQEGFCAALTGHLVSAQGAGLTPDAIRSAAYEECVGGPGIVYMGEEVEEAPAGPATVPASAEFISKVTATVQAVRLHLTEAKDTGTHESIAAHLFKLAQRTIDDIQADLADPALEQGWIEEGLTDLHALIVGATWAPGAQRGNRADMRAFDALESCEFFKRPGKAEGLRPAPNALQPHELTGWRQKTLAMLAEVDSVIQEAIELDATGHWVETMVIVQHAENVREAMEQGLFNPETIRDTTQFQSHELIALLKGARDLKTTPRALALLLQVGINHADSATDEGDCYLDGPGSDELGYITTDVQTTQGARQ